MVGINQIQESPPSIPVYIVVVCYWIALDWIDWTFVNVSGMFLLETQESQFSNGILHEYTRL